MENRSQYNKRRKQYNENRKKRRTRNILGGIGMFLAIVLATSLLVSTFGFMSEGFTNKNMSSWFSKEVNSNNLIKEEDYIQSQLIKETAGGLKVKWKDDGSFVLSGKHEDNDASNNSIYKSGAFVRVVLEAGEYVISTGCENASTEKFGLYVDGLASGTQLVGQKDVTLTIESATTLVIGFFVKNNEYIFPLTSKITPILVAEGSDVVFYQ